MTDVTVRVRALRFLRMTFASPCFRTKSILKEFLHDKLGLYYIKHNIVVIALAVPAPNIRIIFFCFPHLLRLADSIAGLLRKMQINR